MCGFVFTNPQPDEKELAKYYQSTAYISHSNKSHGLIDWAYKTSRMFTLNWKYNLIHKHSLLSPTSILDFGCGTGSFILECMKRGMKIAGVEPSDIARKQAQKTTKGLIEEDIQKITGKFDSITLWHVLEHVAELKTTIESVTHHLTENGTMFIAVPNLKSLDAATYREHWAAYDVPRHLWHFSRTSMETLLTNCRLTLIKTVPMKLDAYYVSLLSEKYKEPNRAVVRILPALLQAWKSNRAARATLEYSSLIYIARK
jgi:2-polyprenyl-3-methyl-5-hydroxy-6-metoxy-1,4-benzoquinol methylase